MARASKWRVGIIVTTLLVAVFLSGLLILRPAKACPLSLAFEKYGTAMDIDFDEVVAFLWLTNASGKTYRLAMTGNTSTNPEGWGGYKASFMVAYEFRDEPPGSITNSAPPASFTSPGQAVVLAPHSGVRLRVPLPPEGQKRKVAVICEEQPAGPPWFLTNRFGFSIFRRLPRTIRHKMIQPAVLRVWCAQELSLPDKRPAKK